MTDPVERMWPCTCDGDYALVNIEVNMGATTNFKVKCGACGSCGAIREETKEAIREWNQQNQTPTLEVRE